MSPADRTEKVELYGRAHTLLTEALGRYPREMWTYRAPHDPWTIHEIVVHIADSEANSFVRLRRLVAEPGSRVLGYDEMRWSRGLDYLRQSPEDALELFRWQRHISHKLLGLLPAAAWENTIDHSENGVMTVDDWLDVYARHVPEHIAQMDAIHAAWVGTTRAA